MSDQLTSRKFTIRLEDAIRAANREIIDPMLPEVDIDTVLPISVMVAKLRGRYLSEAFKLTEGLEAGFPSTAEIDKLKSYRVAYEESLAVFKALEHAIERGYVSVKIAKD